MALTPSQRTTREWPLLVMTLGLVGIICLPLWQNYNSGPSDPASWVNWTPQRWSQLLLGPEQIAAYCCFLWAFFIFASRWVEVFRQRKAFRLGLLPVEEGARILQEDARPLQRKIDQITQAHGPFILANMIRQALAKFALSRASTDVAAAVKTQAEVDQGRLVSTMATMNYLAWAIPAIGFFGTVRGLAGSMTLAQQGGEQVRIATRHLTVAFDCTLVALALSLVVMYLIHVITRDEEALVIDCQQFCLEHLVNRIYEPEPLGEHGPMNGSSGREGLPPAALAGTLGPLPERLAP
jgi:biopolymer transport protein ExbB/TolQ